MKIRSKVWLLLLVTTLFAYLPLILNPYKLLSRGNDLEEQFWPVFYFIRQKFWETHSLPFWNNLFLSGTPLLPDPQFSLFYPPNWLFILLPTDIAFFVWLILHSFFGGLAFYIVLSQVFRISDRISIIGSALYILSPAVANFLEAGHYGLVGTYTWVPLLILSAYFLSLKPSYKWIVFGAVSLSGLFYTHTIIFLICIFLTLIFFIYTLFKTRKDLFRKAFTLSSIFLVGFGLTAITLLPQIDWSKDTTRFLLLTNRQTYPQWLGLQDFLQGITAWITGINGLWAIETEKWMVLGPTLIFLSIVGFLALRKRFKVALFLFALLIFLVLTNNLSPIYNFLLSVDAFVLSRVTTRIWFVPGIILLILACIGLEIISKKHKKYFLLIVVLLIFESFAIFWARVEKPIEPDNRFAPRQVYEYLSQDTDIFRVFCTTRCLSQKQSAIYELQLVEGYNTLQQLNYFKHMWQITGKYWNYYTLAVPPPGIYNFEKIIPDTKSLGEYNTKYIVSPYEIDDKYLEHKETVGDYIIYKNLLLKPRVYGNDKEVAPSISYYSSNHMQVSTDSSAKSIILSEVYSKGWKAYSNGREINIQETPNALRLVDIQNSKTVDFYYKPRSFVYGALISGATVLFIILVFLWSRKIFLHKNKNRKN